MSGGRHRDSDTLQIVSELRSKAATAESTCAAALRTIQRELDMLYGRLLAEAHSDSLPSLPPSPSAAPVQKLTEAVSATESRKYLNTEEAATLLGVSKSYLNKARMTAGDGPEFIKLGARVMYERRQLDSWLAANGARETVKHARRSGTAERPLSLDDFPLEIDDFRKFKDQSGVYFIGIGGQVKIGFATCLLRRIQSYLTHTPHVRVYGFKVGATKSDELDIHRMFAGDRSRGREWYRPSLEIGRYIVQLENCAGDAQSSAGFSLFKAVNSH